MCLWTVCLENSKYLHPSVNFGREVSPLPPPPKKYPMLSVSNGALQCLFPTAVPVQSPNLLTFKELRIGSKESISPCWESIPGLIKRFANSGSFFSSSPVTGLKKFIFYWELLFLLLLRCSIPAVLFPLLIALQRALSSVVFSCFCCSFLLFSSVFSSSQLYFLSASFQLL